MTFFNTDKFIVLLLNPKQLSYFPNRYLGTSNAMVRSNEVTPINYQEHCQSLPYLVTRQQELCGLSERISTVSFWILVQKLVNFFFRLCPQVREWELKNANTNFVIAVGIVQSSLIQHPFLEEYYHYVNIILLSRNQNEVITCQQIAEKQHTFTPFLRQELLMR